MFGATSSGSSQSSSSPGWNADKWVWSGHGAAFSGKSFSSRTTYTKKSATEFDVTSEISFDAKTWVSFREGHCKK